KDRQRDVKNGPYQTTSALGAVYLNLNQPQLANYYLKKNHPPITIERRIKRLASISLGLFWPVLYFVLAGMALLLWILSVWQALSPDPIAMLQNVDKMWPRPVLLGYWLGSSIGLVAIYNVLAKSSGDRMPALIALPVYGPIAAALGALSGGFLTSLVGMLF